MREASFIQEKHGHHIQKHSDVPVFTLDDIVNYDCDDVQADAVCEGTIETPHVLAHSVMKSIEQYLAHNDRVHFSGATSLSVNNFVIDEIEKIAQHHDVKNASVIYKEFVEDVITYIRSDEEFTAKSTQEQEKIISTFAELLLSLSPNILDRIGGLDDSLDVLAQLRSMPQLVRFYEEKMHGMAYDYSFTMDDEARTRTAQQLAHVIDNAPLAKKFHLVRTYRDFVAYGIGGNMTEQSARLIDESLTHIKDRPALLNILIDDVRKDFDVIVAEDFDPRRHIDTEIFWQNKSIDARTTLPEDFHNFRTVVLARDAVGLRNIYGDITHIAKSYDDYTAEGRGEVTDDEKYLIRMKEVIDGTQKYRDFGIAPQTRMRIMQDLQHMDDVVIARNIEDALLRGDIDAVGTSIREGIATLAQQRGARDALVIAREDIVPIDYDGDDVKTLFSQMHSELLKERIEDIIGSALVEIDYRTQLQLLEFLAGRNTEQLARLEKISKDFASHEDRRNFLIAFLSLEHGGQEMGEKILMIGEKYRDGGVAQKIFAKYAELVEAAQSARTYMEEQFGDADMQIVQKVSENLLVRGKKILERYAQQNPDDDALQEALSRECGSIALFKDTIRTLHEQREEWITFSDIAHLDFRVASGKDIAANRTIVAQMHAIYQENYERFPDTFKDKLAASLNERLTRDDTRFYVLTDRRSGDVIAFNTFTPQEDGRVYFGNFNVNPRYSHSKIGEIMMTETLEREAERATIVAHAVPGAKITQTYIDRKLFSAEGRDVIGGEELLRIVRRKEDA